MIAVRVIKLVGWRGSVDLFEKGQRVHDACEGGLSLTGRSRRRVDKVVKTAAELPDRDTMCFCVQQKSASEGTQEGSDECLSRGIGGGGVGCGNAAAAGGAAIAATTAAAAADAFAFASASAAPRCSVSRRSKARRGKRG